MASRRAGRFGIIGTLDTKWREVVFVRDLMKMSGHRVLVIDPGFRGQTPFSGDVDRGQLAARLGMTLEQLYRVERDEAVRLMAAALEQALGELCAAGELDGVIAIGGATNSALAAPGMRKLPLGLPKVLVSPVASGDTRPYVGCRDLVMVNSVADIMGMNRITRQVLAHGVGALIGMYEQQDTSRAVAGPARKTVAITAFGVTTPAALGCQAALEERGYETVVFAANGAGGEAMEELIWEGWIDAVIDLTTTELADELCGGILSAGPHRLEAAAARGIPQVVAPGALDMVNFGAPHTVPAHLRNRGFYQHTPSVTLLRTIPAENAQLGEVVARKLSGARGPVSVVLPLRGFSAYDAPGEPFYWPEADLAFIDAFLAAAGPPVRVVQVDAHINDQDFVVALVDQCLQNMCEAWG